MAKKVTVIHAHTDDSAGEVKKSLAYVMVRRLYWMWLVEGKIAKILPLSAVPVEAKSIRIPLPIRPFIPETLPPVELPQTRFKSPDSLAQWRETHQEWRSMQYS